MEEDLCLRKVIFTEAACEGLDGCVGENARKSKSKFYSDVDSFKEAVTEVGCVLLFFRSMSLLTSRRRAETEPSFLNAMLFTDCVQQTMGSTTCRTALANDDFDDVGRVVL